MRSFADYLKAFEEKINDSSDVVSVVWSIIDFDQHKPSSDDIAALVESDPTLAVVDNSAGHNGINYPDELSVENIVITNIQERLIESY